MIKRPRKMHIHKGPGGLWYVEFPREVRHRVGGVRRHFFVQALDAMLAAKGIHDNC